MYWSLSLKSSLTLLVTFGFFFSENWQELDGWFNIFKPKRALIIIPVNFLKLHGLQINLAAGGWQSNVVFAFQLCVVPLIVFFFSFFLHLIVQHLIGVSVVIGGTWLQKASSKKGVILCKILEKPFFKFFFYCAQSWMGTPFTVTLWQCLQRFPFLHALLKLWLFHSCH